MGIKKKAKKLTPAQLKKIWTKRHELGMPEERLRDIVERISGQRSTRELTKWQGKVIIDVLEGKRPVPENNPLNPPFVRGTENQRRILSPRKFPKVIGRFLPLATQKQLYLIENLKPEAGWDDEHTRNFLLKYYKVETPKELDIKKAGKFIDVLKKQRQKRMNEAMHVLS